MLYEKYEAKVKRSIARRNFFLKYKYYFIALCSILIISMSTLFYMKGKITGNILVPDIKYGQTIDVKDGLSAIMSKHHLEFKGIDDNSWTIEEPKIAGTYQVRGVSKGIFGRRYSKVSEFVIHKETLKVEFDGPVQYQGNPIIKFNTCGNDTVLEDSYKVVIEKYEDRNVFGYIDTTDLKVVNSANVDVTSSYEFKDKYTFKVAYYDYKLDLNLKDINDYDFNNLTFDSNKIEVLGLVNSLNINYDYDILDVNGNSFKNTILIPGRYKLVLSNVKLTDKGSDVTNYYQFDTNLLVKEFNVFKRNLIITTNDITKTYDGLELVASDYTYEGVLLDGHSLNIINNTTVKDAGLYENKLIVNVTNSKGEDVSEYYNITYNYGTITINKVDLTISPLAQNNKVYDSISFIYPDSDMNFDIISGSLVKDESFKLIVKCYKDNLETSIIKNVGLYKIECINTLFSNGSIDNYNITFKDIEFSIDKRNVEIRFDKETFTYDSKTHKHSGNYTVVSGEIVKDELLTVVNENYYTNAGTYLFTPKNFNINNSDSSNYNIISNNIEVEILKANVDIHVKDELVVYHGRKIFASEYNLNKIEINNSLCHVDLIKWHFEKDKEQLPYILDAGVYYIVIDSIEDPNFNVNLTNVAKFEITKASLTVRPSYLTHTYDGNVYVASKDAYEIVSGTLFDDDRIESISLDYYYNDILVEPRNVGTYTTKISSISLLNTNENNYNITLLDGSFNCLRRDVYLNLINKMKTYDGNVFSYPSDEFEYKGNTPYKLVTGDIISLDVIVKDINYEIVNAINVGKYLLTTKTINFIVGDSNNYNITISDASLNITKADLVIDFLSVNDKVYDGSALNYPLEELNFSIVSGQLFNNDSFMVRPYYMINNDILTEAINAGSYQLKISETIFSNGKESNYNIIVTNNREVKILKREVVISPIASTKEYDGNEFDYTLVHNNKFNINLGEIVVNENFAINVDYKLASTPSNVGTYLIYIKDIYGLDTNSDINNYKFTFETSTLEITKRNVTVELQDTKFTYNAKAFDPTNISTTITNLPDGFDLGLTLEYKIGQEQVLEVKNVGTYNVFISKVIVTNNTKDVSENFNVTYNILGSILEITPCDLTIKLGDKLTKEYDGLVYTYNDKPILNGIAVDNLINIDVIEYYDNKNILVEPKNVGLYNAKIKNYSFINKAEALNYNVILEDSILEITKRNVTLNINPIDYIYDSNIYNNSNLTYSLDKGSLDFVSGESITLGGANYYLNDMLVNPIDVNQYTIRAINDQIIYNNLDNNNYNIVINDGILTISPRKVTVTLEEVTNFCYDGTLFEYVNRPIKSASGLLNGDSFTVSLTFRNINDNKIYDKINNVGTYQVEKATYTFTSGKYINYTIEIANNFMFDVTSKEITIITDSFTATFAGLNNKFTIDGFRTEGVLFAGNKVICNQPFVCSNAGTYKNILKVYIVDENGVDITNLYNINYIYGDVIIEKVDLLINYDYEYINKNYDGIVKYNFTYSLIGNLDPMNIDFVYRDFNTNDIVLNPYLVGHYKAYVEVFDKSILDNYNIIINNGADVYKEIIINKIDLSVQTNSTLLPYKPTINQNDTRVNTLGLIDGDNVEVIKDSITNIMLPGSVENKLEVNVFNAAGVNVTDCYNIVYTYGRLSIDDTLHFSEADALKVYDGLSYGNSHIYSLPVYNGNKDIIEDIIVTLYFDPTISLVDAKVYQNVVTRLEIEYKTSEIFNYSPEVAMSYINSYKYDLTTISVKIEKRNIMIKPKDQKKVYDGSPLVDDLTDSTNYLVMPSSNINDKSYGLLDGHSISVVTELSTTYNKADAFSARYKVVEAFIMNGNIDVSSNYNIIKEYERKPEDNDYTYNKKNRAFMARAQIKRRTIYLETGSTTVYYNGLEQYCNEVSIIDMKDPNTCLLDTHYYMVDTNSCGYIEKGTYKNRVRIVIYDNNGVDVTNNYRLSYTYATGQIIIM